nr:hypothetical protein [Tanacetum cinerariifolium]
KDTPGVSVSKKKAPEKDFHISQASGLGDRFGSQPEVPVEFKDKTTCTDEGTGTILGVPNVPKYQFESDDESWGDSEDDDNDNESDDVSKGDDKADSDDDGNDVHDSERTDSDDDENPSFTLKDYKEEEHDEDYVQSLEKYEPNDDNENIDKEEYDDLYKDVDMKSLRVEHEKEGKGDAEMIDADKDVSQETLYEQVVEDVHVTLTSLKKSKGSKQSSSVSSDFASKFLNLINVLPVVDEVASMMNVKRGHEDKDKDEDPPARPDQGLRKRKISKDAKPSRGFKSKEFISSSSKGFMSQSKSFGMSAQAEEPVFKTTDT